MTDAEQILAGPCPEIHAQHGASFSPFGGWSMPVAYAGTVSEHRAVRDRVGLFDVSHLGKAYVKGPQAKNFLNSVFTNDLNKITPGKAQYTLCVNENGGVIDDLIVYYESDESLFLIPNAANTASVVEFLQVIAEDENYNIEVSNHHRDYAIFAVQGPQSDAVLASVGLDIELSYMAYTDAQLTVPSGEVPLRVCRTGYTGERGYEIIPTWDNAPVVLEALIKAVLAHGGQLAGLGARDTLRTEMGYPLHGHELSLDITPVQAGASWAIGWKKDFVGKAVLEAEKEAGPKRVLRALVATGKGVPRPGQEVKNNDGAVVGVVTSGTFSPTLGTGIALALCQPGVNNDDSVVIDVRGRALPAQVTALPLVESHVR